jgi:serine/threonine-protein kinase HipA
VLFNILIHNTDDHLRNHGFSIDENGIRLSPAYDLNPSIERRELTLVIDEVDAVSVLLGNLHWQPFRKLGSGSASTVAGSHLASISARRRRSTGFAR